MRTYNVKFDDNHTGNRFNFKAEKDGFREMRGYIVRTIGNKMENVFLPRLIDLCDDIKEMRVGLTWYIIVSKFEPYVAVDIKNFNRTVAMMERAARKDIGENYMPNEFTAVRIKRTEKMWMFTTLDADVDVE